MICDSIQIIQNLPDTIKFINADPHFQPILRPEYFGLIGVVIGAIISTAGSFLLANRQSKIQIKNTFFLKRWEVYSKISEMSWEGYSIKNRNTKDEAGDYPSAYDSYEGLRNWLNSMVEVIDKNRFLLDQKTYSKFNLLNWKLLEHLRELKIEKDIDIRDKNTRIIGRKNVSEIQQYSESFVDAARQYMKKTYNLNLEKVI
jgi:hypothetical protein